MTELSKAPADADRRQAELVVADIRVRAGGRLLVDGLQLTAGAGELTGLLGPNGSGKTTLIRAIARTIPAETGSVAFAGHDLWTLSRRASARTVAVLEQDAASEWELTARDVVALGRIPHRSPMMPESAADREVVTMAMTQTGTTRFASRRWQTLSGGERQRVQLARALAQQPSLLVLDEPTNHLDVATALELLNLVRSLRTTALVALHDLNLAAAHCDRLVLMAAGRVVAAGTPEQVLTPALLAEIYRISVTVLPHPTTGRPLLAVDPEPLR